MCGAFHRPSRRLRWIRLFPNARFADQVHKRHGKIQQSWTLLNLVGLEPKFGASGPVLANKEVGA